MHVSRGTEGVAKKRVECILSGSSGFHLRRAALSASRGLVIKQEAVKSGNTRMEEAYLESQWRGAGIPDGEGLRHLDGKGAWGQGETLAQRPRGRASRAGGQHTSKVELEGLDVDGHDGRLRRVAIQGWQADDDVAEDKESLAGAVVVGRAARCAVGVA